MERLDDRGKPSYVENENKTGKCCFFFFFLLLSPHVVVVVTPPSLHLLPSLATICTLRMSCSLYCNFQACVQELWQSLCWVGVGGGLLYNESSHRNQRFPAVRLEVLLSYCIPESKRISQLKALNRYM
jgi:hypothetical protein